MRYKIKKGQHISPSTEFKKGHKQSPEICSKKSNKGSKNPNWKGGITKLLVRLRHTNKYYQWRSSIFERDNWTCQTCNKRGGNLEPHHIVAFGKLIKLYNIQTEEKALTCEELWDADNGITLCVPCHKLTKNWGKKNE